MAYRNKAYVCFDGDADIHYYRLMQAWHQNDATPRCNSRSAGFGRGKVLTRLNEAWSLGTQLQKFLIL